MSSSSASRTTTLSVAVAILAGAAAVLIERAWPGVWVQVPLHSTMEAAGAVTAFAVVVVLRWRRRVMPDEAGHYRWIAAMLTLMGTLDLAHACTHVGPAFFWSRALPTFLGGLLAAGVWLSPRASAHEAQRGAAGDGLTVAALGIALVVAALLLAAPGLWPPAFDAAFTYTRWARLINVLGGVGFLLGALCLLRRAPEENARLGASRLAAGGGETTVFAAQFLLLAAAGLLFWVSRVWSGAWWLFHVLRFLSYLVALAAAVRVYRRIEATQRGHLERELAAMMAELEGRAR